MEMVYITHARMPTEKAHGYQIARAVEEFKRHGVGISLFVPNRLNDISEDLFSYYKLKLKYPIVKLWSLDLIKYSKKIGFLLQRTSFSVSVFTYFLKNNFNGVFYGRDEFSLFILKIFLRKRAVFYEMHDFPVSKLWFWKLFLFSINGVVVTNAWKKNRLVDVFNLPIKNILIARNAIDIDDFDIKNIDSDIAKIKKDKFSVGYVGQLRTKGLEKGIGTILGSAKILLSRGLDNILFIIVGGSNEEISYYKILCSKLGLDNMVRFIGQVKHDKVPMYLKIFDIALMPFTGDYHYQYIMSPIKMFEYMAAGLPIIATNLNSVTEVLNESNSFLISPEDSVSMADAIEYIYDNDDFRKKISIKAKQDAGHYSWKLRAINIIDFINIRG